METLIVMTVGFLIGATASEETRQHIKDSLHDLLGQPPGATAPTRPNQ